MFTCAHDDHILDAALLHDCGLVESVIASPAISKVTIWLFHGCHRTPRLVVAAAIGVVDRAGLRVRIERAPALERDLRRTFGADWASFAAACPCKSSTPLGQ